MRHRLTAVSAALLVVAGALGACDSDGGVAPGPDATATGGSSSTPPGDGPSVSPSAEVFTPEDEVLTVAIQDPSTLDPMRIQDPGSVLVARQLYEGLTRWDPVEERAVPAAARAWKITDGGRTFTFKLQQGLTFHDGAPVTSRDFKFSFERIARKSSASDLAYTLARVQGFAAVNEQGSEVHLSGIRTPDATTLVIRLSTPFYEFPLVLTHPGLVPLSPKAVSNDAFLASPVGNGPFQMAQPWAPGQPVVLRSFVGFPETPELDGIRFLPFPDAAASWIRFTNGDLDVAEVPAGQIEAAAATYGSEGFKPFLAGYYYGFNIRGPNLKNATFRRAISRAIDRDFIARSIYKGTMEPPRGIVPSGMPGFQENVCFKICDYAPEGAIRAVRDLPRKKRVITLEYTQGQPHAQVAEAIQGDLRDVGLKVRVKAFPFGEYLRRLRDGAQGFYRLGWIAEFPAPDVFLAPLFGSDSTDNHSGFASGAVDKLLAQARAERSDGARLQLYVEAEKRILRATPIVPIGSFVVHWAAQPNIEGIQFDVMGGFDAVGVSLAEE